MSLIFFCIIASITAIVSAILWFTLRRLTGSTKYAWSLAAAMGYLVGHIGILAAADLPVGELVGKLTAWSQALPTALNAVIWPESAVNWLPIAVLLAGLVSVNSAIFGWDRVITIIGAVMISVLLVFELSALMAPPSIETEPAKLTTEVGVKVVLGILALVAGWVSLQKSTDGQSMWPWLASVAVLNIAVATIFWFSGSIQMAMMTSLVIIALLGGLLVSLISSGGTENLRFSGAAMAACTIGLLLSGWWLADIQWYSVALIILGFAAVGIWMPGFVNVVPYARTTISVASSAAAVALSIFL